MMTGKDAARLLKEATEKLEDFLVEELQQLEALHHAN